MRLSDCKLGYADAAKELLLEPKIFEAAFYDPKGIVDKLLSSWKYILVGRKGVGKSAYNSRIQFIAKDSDSIMAKQLMLNDFEYSIFAKSSSDSDTVGTKKYYDAWNFLMLFQIYKFLHEDLKIEEVENFSKMIIFLGKIGFPIESTFKTTVKNVSRLKMGGSAGVFDAEFEIEFGYKPQSFIERISSVSDKMLEILEEVFFDKKLYLLVDGVDDILRIKKDQVEILSSLLRSIDRLNENFAKYRINVKILLFLREDILSKASDPDLNKIKRDGYIPLSWTNNTNDLKRIAELRINFDNEGEKVLWENIFVETVDNKESWDAVLEHTLYKPRDILQFLCTCQEMYPDKERLVSSEIRRALKSYSREYFIEEMKNELSGYISDDIISIVPNLFQKIGSRKFTVSTLEDALSGYNTGEDDSLQTTRQLLLVLFEAGYVGQLVRTNRNTESVVFKYRNPTASIDYSQSFLVHRGIQRGLGVIV